MSTIIQIKRNSGTTAPTTSDLVIGEMAYAYDASNNGASAKLYIEATNNAAAADIHIIGGKYYTDLLDHTLGTTTASSALLVDSSSKLDVLNVDNVTINGNDISSTDSNGQITLTPNGTGYVNVNKNDGFKLPVGSTAQRLGSPVAGLIRYNSTLSTFEGYGSAWGSLGGVIDVDQDTKITAESAAGQDEDVLTFYIGVSNSAVSQLILADGVLKPTSDNDIDLGTGSLEFKDAYFDGTVNADALVADTADINGGAVDNTVIGGTTPLAGTFTTLTANTSAVIDGVTITDNSGRTLSGQTLEAFVISISHFPLLSIGLNCALGADQLHPYLKRLSEITSLFTSVHPNAGLPNAFGQYDQTPLEMLKFVQGYLRQSIVNIVGGCCGTTPEHISVIADLARKFSPREPKTFSNV